MRPHVTMRQDTPCVTCATALGLAVVEGPAQHTSAGDGLWCAFLFADALPARTPRGHPPIALPLRRWAQDIVPVYCVAPHTPPGPPESGGGRDFPTTHAPMRPGPRDRPVPHRQIRGGDGGHLLDLAAPGGRVIHQPLELVLQRLHFLLPLEGGLVLLAPLVLAALVRGGLGPLLASFVGLAFA